MFFSIVSIWRITKTITGINDLTFITGEMLATSCFSMKVVQLSCHLFWCQRFASIKLLFLWQRVIWFDRHFFFLTSFFRKIFKRNIYFIFFFLFYFKYFFSAPQDCFCLSNQCRPWWNATYISGISSGLSMFAKVLFIGIQNEKRNFEQQENPDVFYQFQRMQCSHLQVNMVHHGNLQSSGKMIVVFRTFSWKGLVWKQEGPPALVYSPKNGLFLGRGKQHRGFQHLALIFWWISSVNKNLHGNVLSMLTKVAGCRNSIKLYQEWIKSDQWQTRKTYR